MGHSETDDDRRKPTIPRLVGGEIIGAGIYLSTCLVELFFSWDVLKLDGFVGLLLGEEVICCAVLYYTWSILRVYVWRVAVLLGGLMDWVDNI
ncbi:hypothetical protein BDW42DRAFT_174513 [Aspergillus taichungensis]|uniref:Uncharacterized protein n=1 Tax=Aspergillus taichungensis TaxID=482145 RepID=A0A2J5HN72_9EURO|nr:hypothetical protein BDW42DRAFT_174513 [Aspergillus taichungensis]